MSFPMRRNYGKLSFLNRMTNCRICGKRTHSSIQGCVGIELCAACLKQAGLKNDHSDNGHPTPVANCPTCHPEIDRARLRK